MSIEPTKQLDRRIVRVWRIHEGISLAVLLAIAVPICWFFPEAWAIAIAAVLLAYQFVALTVLPQVRYGRWRYEVTTTDIVIRSGLIVVKTTVIPMVRVQHVETEQGPILKGNDLASVTITTAGSSFEIPGLESSEAVALRDQVAVLARIAQEDV